MLKSTKQDQTQYRCFDRQYVKRYKEYYENVKPRGRYNKYDHSN